MIKEYDEKVSWMIDAIDSAKGEKITILSIAHMSDNFSYMIVASGTSTRHVSSIGRHVKDDLKEKGVSSYTMEGMKYGEWVLIDFGEILVHIMHPAIRAYYSMEEIWGGVTPTYHEPISDNMLAATQSFSEEEINE